MILLNFFFSYFISLQHNKFSGFVIFNGSPQEITNKNNLIFSIFK